MDFRMDAQTAIIDQTAFDKNTLGKVYTVLSDQGIEKPVELVSALLSAGILFRERIPE